MQVADFVLARLREWGVHRVYGYPGDGINGFLGAYDRAEGDSEFIQVRHEEMAAFMACAHAKFTGEVGRTCRTPGTPSCSACAASTARSRTRSATPGTRLCPVTYRWCWSSRTDPEIPPLPPHIMKSQAIESAKAALHDPQRMGLAAHGFRQKLAEYYEKLPGRDGE